MKDWFAQLFSGRQGMDDLSKTLFWCGLSCAVTAVLFAVIAVKALSTVFIYIGIFLLIYSFIRAFSRRVLAREAENAAFLRSVADRSRRFEAFKERRRQSRYFKFFKCPGCSAMLRVPRGKGKIHIKCKCGYVLYRKT